jgi:peptidyl-prolyl cis-trans isomerase A (cyclophilin A)
MAQTGIAADPAVSQEWRGKNLVDDPVISSNQRGTITYAHAGKNTRTSQIFFNYGDNRFLDAQGFSPFAEVISGMEHIDALFHGYGEGGKGDGNDGKGPNQGRIQRQGNEYLNKFFPKLSYIITAKVVR